MDAKDLFIIGIPTMSGMWDIDDSQLLVDTSLHLAKQGAKRGRLILWSNRHGVDRARTDILHKLAEFLDTHGIEHGPSVRMLWYDADINIKAEAEQLAEMIRTADDKGWNLLGHYWAWDETISTAYSTFRHVKRDQNNTPLFDQYSKEELQNIKPYQELPDTVGGLGFAYIDQPLDWRFSYFGERNPNYGEDIDLFLSTGMPLRWFPVNLFHRKEMLI